MRLQDRLNSALKASGLETKSIPVAVKEQVAPPAPMPVEPSSIQFATFDMLRKQIDDAKDIEPDEDGIRVILVKSLDTNSISLPMSCGSFIVDDIQKRKDGYEVHLIESEVR